MDSNDRERAIEARDELHRMLAEDELRDAVLLVFANKQDLPNAMNATEITAKLGLHNMSNRNWYIQVGTPYSKTFNNPPPHIISSTHTSTCRLPVLLMEMVSMKDWTGSVTSSRIPRDRFTRNENELVAFDKK